MYLITKGNFGGAQKYVFELAHALPKDQFDVSVAYGSGTALKERCEAAEIPTHHIKRLGRDISFFDEFRVLFDLIKLFRKERPDIIHVNSSKIGGLGSLAGRIAGIPKIIFTAHGWAFKEDRSFFVKQAIWLLSYITCILAHNVIVVSNDDQNKAHHFWGTRSKIITIPIGIHSFDVFSKKHALSILEKDSTTPIPQNFWNGTILINIAELTKNKGLIYALEALTHLPSNYKYLLIGDGEDKATLTTYISDNNLENRVVLAGRIEDARALFSLADIMLFSSLKEGLPYTLIEAGFAKVPVISTRVGGIPEIISHEKTGILVSPKSSKSLAHAVTQLTPEKRDRLSTALQTHVKEKFSFAQMLTKTLSLYQS